MVGIKLLKFMLGTYTLYLSNFIFNNMLLFYTYLDSVIRKLTVEKVTNRLEKI